MRDGRLVLSRVLAGVSGLVWSGLDLDVDLVQLSYSIE